MYSLYSVPVPKSSAEPKRTPPTTVRFRQPLHDFVKEQSEFHRQGQSGVINDALEFYKAHVEGKSERIFRGIIGG